MPVESQRPNRRRDYGKLDFESFKQRFNDAGTKQFGSGGFVGSHS